MTRTSNHTENQPKTIFTKYDIRLVKESTGKYALDQRMSSTSNAAKVMREVFELDARPYEMFCMAATNAANEVIGLFELFRGDVAQSNVYIGEVARRALMISAKMLLLRTTTRAGPRRHQGQILTSRTNYKQRSRY